MVRPWRLRQTGEDRTTGPGKPRSTVFSEAEAAAQSEGVPELVPKPLVCNSATERPAI